MPIRTTRRNWMKLAGLGAAAMAKASAAPSGTIHVLQTDSTQRLATGQPVQWGPNKGATDAIVLNPAKTYQKMLGFGGALTDATCYVFNQMDASARARLLHELFDPAELGFSVARLAMGSSDYATKMYSYDEGEPDLALARFSIDHDREYILPALRDARKVNPDLYLFASPWSPPGWMKAGGSMLGGSMRKQYFPQYATYFVKFLAAYREAGVPVDAVSVQNEVDTDQDSRMPACLWGQEYEMGFVADHLGPEFEKNQISTKIWILDHNYNLWGRALSELEDPRVKKYVDGIAWHGYVGEPTAMTRVHEAHPDRHMYWTEGGPDYTDPKYGTDWAAWSGRFAGILRNWARCIIAWNLALDEKGRPNIGPFSCGGLVTIDSRTKEISRSGQYWALAHYSKAIRRGAQRIDSTGTLDGVSHVAFANPGGTHAAILSNEGPARKAALRMGKMAAEIHLPTDSVTTLTW